MAQYLALVKIPTDCDRGTQLFLIQEELQSLAGRLVEEFGLSADQVAAYFEDAMTMAYETEHWMEQEHGNS